MLQYVDMTYPANVTSYPLRDEIWEYLDSYANQFDLKKNIKFTHLVKKIKPIAEDKWNVTVIDLRKNATQSNIFDAVVICNGRNFLPNIPVIDGHDKFKGKIMHSHDFRTAEKFRGW